VPPPEPNISRLLRDALRTLERETLRRLHAAGYPDISVAQTKLLGDLDEDGSAQGVLVERSGLTAQAVSQLIEQLVGLGYLAREALPGDRRARRIVWTEHGRRGRAVALELLAEMEAELAQRVGERRYATARRTLRQIAEQSPGD
jgi:DNA-binding MarR family transcriptional regulator